MKTNRLFLGFLATRLLETVASASCDLPTLSLPLGPYNVSISGDSSQSTVYSYGLLLVVGGTRIVSTPSTFASTPLLDFEDVCSAQNQGKGSHQMCRSRRGNYLPMSLATESADGLKGLNPNVETFKINISKATKSPIELLPGKTVQVLSGAITEWENHTNSHFPLNDKSTVLDQLKQTGLIGARSFAIDVGSQTGSSGRRGRVTLGGWQPEMVKGAFIEYPMNYSQSRNDRLCPLQVGIQTLSINVGTENIPLISPDQNAVACIEPYDKYFRLPDAQLTTLKHSITRIHNLDEAKDDAGVPYGRYGDILDLEPGLVYSRGTNLDINDIIPMMQITLSGGLDITLSASDLVQPLRGLNTNGIPIISDKNLTEVSIYRESGIGSASVLGRAFLSKLYMFVDYENSVFRLGLIDEDAQPQVPISSGSCSTSLTMQDKGLIAMGAVLGALIIAMGILAFFFVRKFKSQRKEIIQLQTLPHGEHGDGPHGPPSPPNDPVHSD